MTMAQIVTKAKALGISGIGRNSRNKLNLIREIQSREGNFPCFGTSDGYCDQSNCCFREDCLSKDFS